MKKLKNKLYFYFVERNEIINEKYNEYVESHMRQHKRARIVHWIYLLGLNLKYSRNSSKSHEQTNELTPKNVPARTTPAKTTPAKTTPAKTAPAKTVPATATPYLNGSESDSIFISKPIHFVKKLLNYDVVSFDVFDTLIYRTFSKPTEIFSIVGNRLGILNFESCRIAAEKKARELKKINLDTIEVTLPEIYDVLSEMTGIDAQKGVQIELQVEMELVHANPYMLRVFDLLKAQGKVIIAVSDMYMQSDMILALLEKCGYKGFEKVYSSADYLFSKSSGKLFQAVQWDFENKNIVHIGDNYNSDCKQAKAQGIAAYYYKNVNMVGNAYRPPRLNSLAGSLYCSLLNEKYYCGLQKYSPLYEIGYSYVGFYVLGYVNWIHEYAKKHNIDKILFLARDGDIYKQVYDKFYTDVKSEYVYWSRAASIKCDVLDNWNMFIMHFFEHKSTNMVKSKLGVLFDNVGLGELKRYFSKHGLFEKDVLDSYNIVRVKKFLTIYRTEVEKCYEYEQKELIDYITSIVGTCENVALIDIGWSGSVLLPMAKFIRKHCNNECNVHCLMAAGRPLNNSFYNEPIN